MQPPTRRRQTDAAARRLAGAAISLGALLFAAMTAWHPPLVDPRAVSVAMDAIAAAPQWALIHWGLAVAVTGWGCGLLALHILLKPTAGGRCSPYAAAATVLSTALWLVAFVSEAAGGAALAQAYHTAGGLAPMVAAIRYAWSSTLALGYAAAALLGAAVAGFGIAMRAAGWMPAWLPLLGVIAGAATLIAQPLAWLFPAAALFILIPPGAALIGWSVLVGARLAAQAAPPRRTNGRLPGR